MKILEVPYPTLTQKARPVKKIDKNIRRLITQMKKTLAQSKIGVGLAAPQIGIPRQIFIISYKFHKAHEIYKSHANFYQVFLNPKVSAKTSHQSPVTSYQLEGCLSIPNVWGYVARAKEIKLKYLDERGKKHHRTFRGFLATIIQHEIDHLNGVLFTEHVLSQKRKLYRQVKETKTGKEVMEEIEV